MNSQVLLLCIAVCVSGTFANRCVDQEDGHVVESGCHVGVVCEGGQEVEVICLIGDGLVFDPESGECKPIEDEEGPCAYPKDCTGVPNGRYPICELDCVWYFTCVEGNNAGNTQCIDTVFDFRGQFCNWAHGTCPPCGTLVDPSCTGDEVCDIGKVVKIKAT